MPRFQAKLSNAEGVIVEGVDGFCEELPKGGVGSPQYEGGFNHNDQLPAGLYTLIFSDGRVLPIALFPNGFKEGKFEFKFFDTP